MNAITHIRLSAAIAFLGLCVAPLQAQSDPVKVSGRVFQEEVVTAPDGRRAVRHVPAARLYPGNEVIYEVTYANVGKKPTEQVVITNPLPADLGYRPSPARDEGTVFEVSVDHGVTYGDLALLKVREGSGLRAARASDITHVRWTINEPVQPGQAGKVALRAVIR